MMTAQAYSTGRQKIMHTAQEKRRFLYDGILMKPASLCAVHQVLAYCRM
ncbi:predicted protein [Botrytis cinerea T4]|uniref:Uncharacterized protein n=1 Tax=Botryotinia fuckeliana (strain T4) TaxID=999810 RepID=G2XXE2_BOTF4|nr:predicted protein [Botrytis cinerea T4]